MKTSAAVPLLVADRDIPFLQEFFSPIARLRPLPAAEISPRQLADADALLVRSNTQVGERLLSGSRVQLVLTATTGTDHLDTDWLRSVGIGWASGAGGNARAVAEYVLAAIGLWLQQRGRHIAQVRCGLVGCGRIGGMLREVLRCAGAEVLACDPLRDDCAGVGLQQVLDCDLVSLHVPLSRSGRWPTRHLLSAAQLRGLSRRDALFINTARGEVLAPDALSVWTEGQNVAGQVSAEPRAALALDVWPDEAAVSVELVRRCALCSAHLAGHSLEGRLHCLWLAAARAAEFFGMSIAAGEAGETNKVNHTAAALPVSLDELSPPISLNAAQVAQLREQTENFGLPVSLLATAVPLRQMRRELLQLKAVGGVIAATAFQQLRLRPPRRELTAYQLPSAELPAQTRQLLQMLSLMPEHALSVA